jgi:hypothetical protein
MTHREVYSAIFTTSLISTPNPSRNLLRNTTTAEITKKNLQLLNKLPYALADIKGIASLCIYMRAFNHKKNITKPSPHLTKTLRLIPSTITTRTSTQAVPLKALQSAMR